MKRLILLVLILGVSVSLFAQQSWSAVQTPQRVAPPTAQPIPEYHIATGSGNWGFVGSRLLQNDPSARLAKVNFRVPQSGPMIYEFNVRYESGIEDGHGGFGLHIFGDQVVDRASWGSGSSWLLWLNYDENPYTPGFIRGFSAQVYRSTSQSTMTLIESFDLNMYDSFLSWDVWSSPVPAKIWVDGVTGEVRVYDPTDPALMDYFYFYLPISGAIRGDWVSLRTNGLSLSFDM